LHAITAFQNGDSSNTVRKEEREGERGLYWGEVVCLN